MALKLIEAPEIEPVTIDQAIKHLNEYAPETVEVEEPKLENPEDSESGLETLGEPAPNPDEEPAEEPEYGLREHVADLIATARETCEEYQNRAYLTQTWELWLDAWPPVVEIPRPPLQSIVSIKWYDRDNAEHIIDAADYFADVNSEPGRVLMNPGKSWPANLRPASGISITFTAGHAEAASVPRRVRQAILLLVAEWYLNREATSLTGKGGAEKFNREIPFGVTRLLDYDRVVPV
jgi:uncharacterized phiE125 gp8 family phage protein